MLEVEEAIAGYLGILPPKYDGKPGSDAYDFIKKVETCKAANNWSERQTMRNFARCLQGQAFDFLIAEFDKTPTITWDTLRENFLKKFQAEKIILLRKLLELRQKKDEPPTSFLRRTTMLTEQIDKNMPETNIVEHVMSGLLEKYNNQLVLHDNLTLAKLTENLEKIEKNESLRRMQKHKIDILIEQLDRKDKLDAVLQKLNELQIEKDATNFIHTQSDEALPNFYGEDNEEAHPWNHHSE